MSGIAEIAGNCIGGNWLNPIGYARTGVLSVRDPGDLSKGVIAQYGWSSSYVFEAVTHARQAFPAWRKLPWDQREAILRRAQAGISTHKEKIVMNIASEMGKPIAEARAEVDVMGRKFDVVLPDAQRIREAHVHPDEPHTTVRGEPLGVTAVIGPFNFPGHLVNGMVLPALATGNTVVLKPASITPGVWRIVTEIFHEAGLPVGVLNYVLGDRSVGQALAAHPDVDLLLFTGGVMAGRAIKVAAAGTHKEVKLEMGGQGVALVLEDADLEKAADLIVKGATVRGGQNCNGTRHVFVVGDEATKTMTDALIARLERIKVGHQLEPGIDYGPLAFDPRA